MTTASRSPSRSRSTEATLLALLLACGSAAAQTVSNNTSLSFGAFTAGSGGTVNLSAIGARSKTGGVMLSSQGAPASAAQFSIGGTASSTVVITLPADGTVTLTDGANTMALNGFVSNPNGTGIVGGGGTLIVSVGAVLTVGSAQPPGSYTGSFNVTVDYQ